MLFYDVNYSMFKRLPANSMYFHAYWHRDTNTSLGKDFQILPQITGKGRFLGCNVGVICNKSYKNSWFGEGEVKIFIDGDKEFPTLCGTGTEDYVGTGWGQNSFHNMTQGSPIGDSEKGLYSFYRYHTVDPVYFHKDCRVTIQQLGNTSRDNARKMLKDGLELEPVSVWDSEKLHKIYDGEVTNDLFSDSFIDGGVNYWRRDDVCATAYFYTDMTSSELPSIQDEEIRIYNLNYLEQ